MIRPPAADAGTVGRVADKSKKSAFSRISERFEFRPARIGLLVLATLCLTSGIGSHLASA